MIEFKYDEKMYRKMSLRIMWWFYALIVGIVVAVFAWISSIYISDYVNGETELAYTLIVLGIFLTVLIVLVAVMFVSSRKQLAKNFAMYSANGVVIQVAEVTDEELIVTNVSRHNVTRMLRRDIASVKKYKDFFVVVTNTKVKLAVPLDSQTQLLYDVLTGAATVEQLPTKPSDTTTPSDATVESEPQQPTAPQQTDALSFEYELTEPQAINMLTKIISVRYRVVFAAIIIFSLFTAGLLGATVVNYVTDNRLVVSYLVLGVICAIATTLFSVAYANKNKSGRVSGGNYFRQQCKDGQCVLSIELYDQGIVAVNKLRDTRVYFRIADMEKVRLFTDFFYVELKSKEVLPVPLTEQTKRLYDILNNALSHKQ